MKRLLLIAAALVAVAALVQAATTVPAFRWELPRINGGWGGTTYRGALVETTCDGPHRVYVARSADGNAATVSIFATTVSIFVLKNGCAPERVPAEAP